MPSLSVNPPEPEVFEKAVRRHFTGEYKLNILHEAESCQEPGSIGSLLRREGLYSSHLTTWRRQRDAGIFSALKPKQRGRKANPIHPFQAENEQLRKENNLLQKRLEKAELIIDIQKKNFTDAGNSSGDPRERRGRLMEAIEVLTPEVGTQPACVAMGIPRSNVYRHRARRNGPQPEPQKRPSPLRALSSQERHEVLEVLHSERFVDKAPQEVYAALLDEGQYLCSIRTMYRLLDERKEVKERRNQLRHPSYQKPELLATASNKVWSWDITKLLGPVKWTYFYLYVILDIFSRYVVGWMVASRESALLAEKLIHETCQKQRIQPGQLIIHADRGSSMKSKPVALLLADLGVTKTHSRPHTSEDNPYSEAQFKTLKYRPDFPDRFGSMEDARGFCQPFFTWYNTEHHHSGIGLLTPQSVHYGQAETIFKVRQKVLLSAYEAHPERFVRKIPAPPRLPEAAWINPPKPAKNKEMLH
ncbi:MAG: IS3 family transposase [Thermodesulfobacteriota bacterium]|nr:IS3 family transposase [Thermodesulfobacteriota bacterium]